ncbi:MAG: hypothetical protein ACMXYE_02890 [Candidatus Woesearchaeota archaeon]
MNRKIELEIILTAVIFLSIVGITNIDFSQPGVTGHAVLHDNEQGQITIQQLLRNEIFKPLQNVRMCIHIRQDEDHFHTYRIRQRAGIFHVTNDTFYCEGKMNEDFVFLVENYNFLQKAVDNPKLIMRAEDSDITPWESRFIPGGDIPLICSTEVKENYCPFITEVLTARQRNDLGITCCDDDASMNVGLLTALRSIFAQFWWLALLISISGTIGLMAMYILGRDEEFGEDEQMQLKEYILKAREENFGDYIIREQLQNAGWPSKDINTAFESLRDEHLQSFGERFAKLDELNIVQKGKDLWKSITPQAEKDEE